MKSKKPAGPRKPDLIDTLRARIAELEAAAGGIEAGNAVTARREDLEAKAAEWEEMYHDAERDLKAAQEENKEAVEAQEAAEKAQAEAEEASNSLKDAAARACRKAQELAWPAHPAAEFQDLAAELGEEAEWKFGAEV